MSKKSERLAKALCGVLNEIGDASTFDMAPSFYKIDGIWFEVDPARKNTFVVSDTHGKNDDKRPRYRVIVEEI